MNAVRSEKPDGLLELVLRNGIFTQSSDQMLAQEWVKHRATKHARQRSGHLEVYLLGSGLL